MKLTLGLLILLAACGGMILTPTIANTRRTSIATMASRARLQLTTRVLEQKSCSPDHFGLSLRLTFENVGEQVVILHKQSAISRIMVSSNLAAASAKHYEEEMRNDDPGADIGLESPVASDFRILRAGETVESEERVSLYLFNAKRTSEQFLKEGTHILQVDVGTWPYVADPAPFRRQWRDKGHLWFEGITSEPMPFTIEKDRPIVECH